MYPFLTHGRVETTSVSTDIVSDETLYAVFGLAKNILHESNIVISHDCGMPVGIPKYNKLLLLL